MGKLGVLTSERKWRMEMQLTDYSKIDIHGCWGDIDMDCEGVHSDGRSGGFNKLIPDAGIIDFNMVGNRYTYKSRVDANLSKIDRFLACSSFLSYFPSLTATAHPRYLSDHFPLLCFRFPMILVLHRLSF
uniref:Endonuclease/exonuclease/phosphatase domain-containing protein n=1 Tax=Lactuca sativa TaxID=4236 RepID=A0A9R1VUQ2_LACSA|nr:hypothetical protein LSAT_V11C400202760 [Lactuca sativa]